MMPNHFSSSERLQTKKRALVATAPVCGALSNGAERTGRLSPASRWRVVPSAPHAWKLGPSSPTRTGIGTGVTMSDALARFWSTDALPSGTEVPQAARPKARSRRARRIFCLWRAPPEKSMPALGRREDGLLADEIRAAQLQLGAARAG